MDPHQANQALAVPPAHPSEGHLAATAPWYGTPVLAGDAQAGPPGLTAAPTLPALIQALRRRWPLALGLGVVAALVAVAVVFIAMPPRYVVEARFNIMAAPDTTLFGPNPDPHAEFAVFKEYEKALVRSPLVLAAALNEKTSTGREVRELPIVRAQQGEQPGTGVIDWMDRALKADFKVAPEIMSAWLSGDDPDGLAELLNAIAAAFIKENDEKDKARRKEKLDLYGENLKLKEQELSSLRAKLNARNQPEDAKRKHGKELELQQAQQELGACKVLLQSLQTRQGENELELADWQAKLKSIQTQPVPADQVDEFLRADNSTLALKKRIEEIDALIIDIGEKSANAALAQQLIDKEKVNQQQLQQLLDKRRATCMPEVENRYRSRLKVDLSEKIESAERKRTFFGTQIKGLRDQSENLGKLILALDPALQNEPPDLTHLKDEIESTKIALDQIRRTMLMLSIEGASSRVSLQMRASPPTDKDYSRQTKLAGAGGVSAFALILFGVSLWEFRTRRISMTSEVSHGLGLHLVGTLPAIPVRANGKAPGREVVLQAQLEEAVDGVRTMLLHAARSEPLRVVMVTSACGGEGKTSVATQLAASLARAWRKTLLIDGDLRNPAVHRVFELPREPGLSEVLRGEVSATDAIRPASVSRLWVLPAGQWDSHAIQALAQDDVHALFEQLKGQYDFIIIDSSPVLPVADALLLAQHVDGVLYSIMRDVSRVPEVFAAQQRLAPLGVRTLGAVAIGMTSDLSKRAYQYAAS
jgi:polysaccharide biosynthesis transport protein